MSDGIMTMNAENSISNETKLYGLISENAQQNRLFVFINRLIKKAGSNGMIIPMNIRPDDFYFTLSNMKKSHVNGAWIDRQYQKDTLDIIDSKDKMVEISGLCDFVTREAETLHGTYLLPNSIKSFVKEHKAEKIAIIGAEGMAEAIVCVLKDKQLALFDPEIERILNISQNQGIEVDINRLTNENEIDLKSYDLVINTLDIDVFKGITKLSPICLDLRDDRDDALHIMASLDNDVEYFDYTSLLETISENLFNNIIKE